MLIIWYELAHPLIWAVIINWNWIYMFAINIGLDADSKEPISQPI